MARARLHLICGNCGCNDDWVWYYVPDEFDDDDGELMNQATVFLKCCNCSTLHDLSDNAEIKP